MTILDGIVSKDFFEEVSFKLKSYGRKGASHVRIIEECSRKREGSVRTLQEGICLDSQGNKIKSVCEYPLVSDEEIDMRQVQKGKARTRLQSTV